MADSVEGQQDFCAPVVSQIFPGQAGECVLLNRDFKCFLQERGLTDFAGFWNLSGETVKDIGTRSVVKIVLQSHLVAGQEEKANIFYLKKHREKFNFFQKLFFFMTGVNGSEGLKEFNFYTDFRENGLATAVPVAAGCRFVSFFKIESFLLTRDFSPFVALEDLVLQRPKSLIGIDNRKKRLNILTAIALYARKMHKAGLNQQDFNATHVLLNNLENGPLQIALFDLQRVDKNPLKRLRWPIKALAELNFTLPTTIFSQEERLALFCNYKNKKKLSLMDKLQYRWIVAKTERIARHSRKRNLAPKMVEEQTR
jgi:hypothetical protein